MRIVKSFWKPMVWSAIVLILSAMSGEKVNEIGLLQIPYMDKVCHFGMYFTLTFLLLFDFKRLNNEKYSWLQVIFFSLCIAIAYGGTMEILQIIPRLHRSSDFYDFLANSSGAIAAVFAFKPIVSVLGWVSSAFIKPKQNYSL
jgi:VanZ family protein